MEIPSPRGPNPQSAYSAPEQLKPSKRFKGCSDRSGRSTCRRIAPSSHHHPSLVSRYGILLSGYQATWS